MEYSRVRSEYHDVSVYILSALTPYLSRIQDGALIFYNECVSAEYFLPWPGEFISCVMTFRDLSPVSYYSVKSNYSRN